MEDITVEHNPSPAKLDAMNVEYWPIWEKEVSVFDWEYDSSEKCYVLEGEAIITPANGEPVVIKARDLVNFSKGLACKWEVTIPIKKHYILG